jgi:protein-arginine kinase activator protein McsA
LNHKEKMKREQAKHQTAKVYWDAYWRSFHATFTSCKATELQEQLAIALKAEDYEEAARIRDLIKKQ